MSIPLIILLVIIVLGFAMLVFVAKKKIKEVMAWQKRAIRKIAIKKRFYFIYLAGVLIFTFLFFLWHGIDWDIFNHKPFRGTVLIGLLVFALVSRVFVELKSAQILVIDEGLVITNRLIQWAEIDSIREFKYSIKIFTKIKSLKKVKIRKIFRHMDQTDMDLIKSLWTAGRS